MANYSVKPIKKLGQNFLRDENVLRRIADAAELNEQDIVLEIGTGSGNLTKYLCQKAKFVYTIEKDARLCRIAEENLREFKNVKVVCDDALDAIARLACLTARPLASPPSAARNEASRIRRLKVIGNLPYYITTPIIFKLLGQRQRVSDIVITVQKEVARRIAAKPGNKDYGILSCLVQFHTQPRVMFEINKTKFYPQPEVDSALVRMKVLEKPAVIVNDEEKFLKIIKAAFSHRRKTLLNSLYDSLDLEKKDIKNILQKCGIDPERRAETLDLNDFAALANFCC